MERTWMEALREERYVSLRAAADAAKCSPTLLRIIEGGSVTLPEIAKRIGKAYGMTKEQVKEITCEATVARRAREARMTAAERDRDRMQEAYQG